MRSGRTIRPADPMPPPVDTPQSDSQSSETPTRKAGRPSKLEERAYLAMLTMATPGMSPERLESIATASWLVAEAFERVVRQRKKVSG